MTAIALLFTLSAIGISETSYLIRKRIAMQKPVCFLGENCALVLESRYGRIFIVPNDILGLIFYVAASFMAALLVIGIGPLAVWSALFKVMIIVGSFVSVFFYLSPMARDQKLVFLVSDVRPYHLAYGDHIDNFRLLI